MLKPVSILALDEASASLANAVQQRIARTYGLDDLVQARSVASGAQLGDAIQSIHAQRQRPESPLRVRDDISARELVLLIVASAGPARALVLDTAHEVRQLYERKRLASYFSIEILCLLPEITPGSGHDAAYGLLKALSAANPKPFNDVWLIDAMNAKRVRFGALERSLDTYADAVAGVLVHEPEMSGALPGLRPRGVDPTFSSFGYAELVFPRDVALQRVEPRFAAELLSRVILHCRDGEGSHAALSAKQFVVGDELAIPMSRIGVDAGQSLFKRFQAKTFVTERTRDAEEVIAAVRAELSAYRDGTHLRNLQMLVHQAEGTAIELDALLTRVLDETLDRDDYPTAIRMLEALIDPLPELRADADAAPRNLVTEIKAATAALDARLRFTPNTATSSAARKRVRELDQLLRDQKLVADTLSPAGAAAQLEELEREKSTVLGQLPEILFADEMENSAARNATRDAEMVRLAEETRAKEQQLRELFTQCPRAEQALREALEARRVWLRRQILSAASGVAAFYLVPFVFGILWPNLSRITTAALTGLTLFAVFAAFRYSTQIAPHVRALREALERLRALIETTDKAKNAAHNDELAFEYDVAHRRAMIDVLRRTRESASHLLDELRARWHDLETLAGSFAQASISGGGLTISIVDDDDVDAWYERTEEERKPFVRDFPIPRSESRRLPLEELRTRMTAYASSAFDGFRRWTLSTAATSLISEAKLAQRLKRFIECGAPLIEVREDDLPAQQVMQRDTTLWIDAADAVWLGQVQRRLPDAHIKNVPDALSAHAVSRILHFPGYALGQIDFYRAEYERAPHPDHAGVTDLVPTDLVLTGALRTAYEQVLLGRALGLIEIRADGQLASDGIVLGDSHLAAAHRLASTDAALARERLDGALAPRLSIAADVERHLRRFADNTRTLSPLDRGVIAALVKQYAPELS